MGGGGEGERCEEEEHGFGTASHLPLSPVCCKSRH